MDFTVSRPEIKKLVCKYSVEALAATFNMEEVLVGPSPGTVKLREGSLTALVVLRDTAAEADRGV